MKKLSISCCFSVIGTLSSFAMAFSPRIVSPIQNYIKRHSPIQSQSSENEEDWRNFRAKLVMQYRNLDDITSTITNEDSSNTRPWAYESGQTIEKGSIILSRDSDGDSTDSGLAQQFFHKAIILVLDHEDGVGTRGIILNRPSNLVLSDDDFVNADGSPLEWNDSENQWKTWFGGEVNGILSEDPEIICLHSLPDCDEDEESEEIMKGIKTTSLENARKLVQSKKAIASDFLTFIGYCGWEIGQLREELETESWFMVAADSKTVLDELKKNDASEEILDAGVESWSLLMKMIGEEDGNDDVSEQFEDLMLREWTKERLLYPSSEEEGEEQIDKFISKATSSSSFGSEIGVGSVLRSTASNTYNPFLLSDQEYHKCILLILQDDEEMSVGVILNMPTSTEISLELGGKKSFNIPERYGGRFADASDQDVLLWFHCNDILKDEGIGEPLGLYESGIWSVQPDDAASAIAAGNARAEDFIVVSGISVWEKAPGGLTGGIRGEVNNNLFEVVGNEIVDSAWDALLQQELMSEETLDENLSLIELAWSECSSEDESIAEAPPTKVYNSNVTVAELADKALRKWVSAFMLSTE